MTDTSDESGKTPLVFVSDPSAEAHALVTSLQQRGYAVIEVASSLLAGRIAAQPPSLLICDGTYTAQAELTTLLEQLDAPVVFLGSPTPDFKLGLRRIALPRPVEVESLLTETARLIGAPRTRERPSAPPTAVPPPLLLSSDGSPEQPEAGIDHKLSSSPALSIPPAPRLPAEAAPNLERAHSEISAELAELLRQAEQTLRDASGPPLTDAQRALVEPDLSATEVVADELLGVLDDALDPAESDASHLLFAAGVGPEPARSSATAAGLGDEPTGAGGHETLSGQTRASQPVTQAGAPISERPSHAPARASMRPGTPNSRGATRKSEADEETTNPGGRAPAAPDDDTGSGAVAENTGTGEQEVPEAAEDASELTAPGDDVALAAPPAGRNGAVPAKALLHIAKAVADRFTGALAFQSQQGLRRLVLRDGDFVTVASTRPGETLISYVRDETLHPVPNFDELAHKVAPFGRHGGAALVAAGVLAPDDLWSVLRGHGEWLLTKIMFEENNRPVIETQVPERFAEEPSVFGGRPGAEAFVGVCKACFDYGFAWRCISDAQRVVSGPHRQLLGESGLAPEELAVVEQVCQANSQLPNTAKPWCATLLTLGVLGVLDFTGLTPNLLERVEQNLMARPIGTKSEQPDATLERDSPPSSFPSFAPPAPVRPPREPSPDPRPIAPPPASTYEPVPRQRMSLRPDTETRREAAGTSRLRIEAQERVSNSGDYFSVLGLDANAGPEEVESAYQKLRDEFEPSRALSSDTADLAASLDDILAILDEAHAVLRDPRMLEEYRQALR